MLKNLNIKSNVKIVPIMQRMSVDVEKPKINLERNNILNGS